MKSLFAAGLLCITCLLTTHNADAAARAWELDRAHANIYFDITHIFSTIRGDFGEFTLETHFEPKNLAASSFSCTIETSSINTGIDKRDDHLRSADFFDAQEYPQITFKSTSITDLGKGSYEVKGALQTKGKTQQITVPLTLVGIKAHPAMSDKDVAGLNATITLDLVELGIGDGKFHTMGMLGKDVKVLVSLELLADK